MHAAQTQDARRDAAIIALVGAIHGVSHFLQLVLPSVFLAIRRDWDISFSSLGLTATVFYVVSGVCQTAAGFVVDRIGARPVLLGGLALFSGAIGLMALAPSFEMLLLCSALAGVGNSVFHPADFGILNAAVSPRRLGPAFSAHSISGNIGWALAPPCMTSLLLATGSWRVALAGAAAIGLAVLALGLLRRDLLEGEVGRGGPAAPRGQGSAAVLLSTPILLCFVFFMLIAAALIGIQTFGIPILNQTFHLGAELAAWTLTTYLLAGGAGIALGGWVAAQSSHHERIAAVGMAAAALCVLAIATGMFPGWAILVLLGAAGFLSGITNPSRDLLVRGATPRGSTGKVFGFVYSGLDAGSAIAPTLFGILLDHGRGDLVFAAVALIWLSTIVLIFAMKGVARG